MQVLKNFATDARNKAVVHIPCIRGKTKLGTNFCTD